MADTLSLDAAVSYILERGGSVRLIGDDQQLAAIGAGGVLRDIRATHGALQLTELVRFTDPAEGAASLALREGKTEALGFYLDRDRVHVGDLATMTEDVFAAWQADRAAGLDSIMLAPTRDLVSELNQQARAHRLDGIDPADVASVGPVRRLADGNEASIGELIITRENDRRLRTSATDWVKNGDRWTVLEIHDGGDLTVQHTQHGRTVRLPSDYVADGHRARLRLHRAHRPGRHRRHHARPGHRQRVAPAALHDDDPRRARQPRLPRGRRRRRPALGDPPDPGPAAHPHRHPRVDAGPRRRPAVRDQPAPRAGRPRHPARRGRPALPRQPLRRRRGPPAPRHRRRRRTVWSTRWTRPSTAGSRACPTRPPGPPCAPTCCCSAPAGENPVEALRAAAGDRELDTRRDRAAVLDWRLDASGLRNAGTPGRCRGCPASRPRLAEDPHWGAYLTQRAHLVEQLADQVHDPRQPSRPSLPVWAQNGIRPDAATVADVEVWRAAMQVPADDRRPTGAPQLQKAVRDLAAAAQPAPSPATTRRRSRNGATCSTRLAPQVRDDEFTPLLAERLAAMSRAGVTAHQLLRTAAAPTPGRPAARRARRGRAVVAHGPPPHARRRRPDRRRLPRRERHHRLGAAARRPVRRRAGRAHPGQHLVAGAGHQHRPRPAARLAARGPAGRRPRAAQRRLGGRRRVPGAGLADLDRAGDRSPTSTRTTTTSRSRPRTCGRASSPTRRRSSTTPTTSTGRSPTTPARTPIDLRRPGRRVDAVDVAPAAGRRRRGPVRRGRPDAGRATSATSAAPRWSPPTPTSGSCTSAPRSGTPPPSRASACSRSTSSRRPSSRTGSPSSWGRDYLTDRFGVDLAGHEHFRPGQAPAGWTNLVDHLRRHGVSDAEMLATGVATEASTGRLIDRFRDRVMFPVIHQGEVLGFVGRRHPDLTDDDKARTEVPQHRRHPAVPQGRPAVRRRRRAARPRARVPVIVEGPMDAIAVTLASAGRYLGVAPLGTSLTDEQAAQLAAHRPRPDRGHRRRPRRPGRRRARLLDAHPARPRPRLRPVPRRHSTPPTCSLSAAQPRSPLRWPAASPHSGPWATSCSPSGSTTSAPSRPGWPPCGSSRPVPAGPGSRASTRCGHGCSSPSCRPAGTCATRSRRGTPTRARPPWPSCTTAARSAPDSRPRPSKTPAERWAPLARELDPRLLEQGDWPATAAMLQQAHEQGHDVGAATRAIVAEKPLGDSPARDLRYRIVSRLEIPIDTGEGTPAPTTSQGAARDRQNVNRPRPPRRGTPRR